MIGLHYFRSEMSSRNIQDFAPPKQVRRMLEALRQYGRGFGCRQKVGGGGFEGFLELKPCVCAFEVLENVY